MGVIKRQGLKQSIVVYAGMVIGMVNVLYIYPKFLSQDEFGLIRFLTETANLFAPFLLVGAQNLSVRFFPEFRNEEKSHHGFFWLLLLHVTIGVAIGTGLYLLFREQIYDYYAPRNVLFEQYFYALWILTALLAFNLYIRNYSVNFKRIVLPTLIHDYSLKIGIPLLVVCYFLEWLTFGQLVNGLIFVFALDLFLQLIYLKSLRGLGFGPIRKMLSRDRLKRMLNFALFGVMGSLGYKVINYLDAFMVGTLVDLKGVAVYSIAFVIANFMRVPYQAIKKISGPIISNAWNENNPGEILKIYRKSSQLLFTLGCGLFLLIWVNVDSIYQLMPNGQDFIEGKEVILILGLAKVIDITMGINAPIIGFSKYYRFNFYSMSVLALANIGLNLWLIPLYGITGAALATFFSLVLFNLVRFGYSWWRFGMQPFTFSSLAVLALAVLTFGLVSILPAPFHPFLNVVWQTVVTGLFFALPVLWFRWCPDLNDLFFAFAKRLLKIFKRA